MAELEQFTIVEDHAEYRPTGRVSLERAIDLIASAIAHAREHKVRRLLVVTLGLTGITPPTVTARYTMMTRWAAAAQGLVKVAVVTKPEMIDAQKFGVTVAANHGLALDVFTSEEEALAWLQRI